MKKWAVGLGIVFGLLFGGTLMPSWAQTSPATGAIVGTVHDPSGAIVSTAKVALTNANLNIHRETETQSDGGYVFPLLPPGSGYQVSVEHAGFRKAIAGDLTVRITQVTTANIELVIGTITETVNVSGIAEAVQTTNATLGSTVQSQVINSLPLPTRNVLDLVATDAGVAATLTSPAATILQGSQAVFVGGAHDSSNNYVVNGVDANNFEFHTLANGIVPVPNPDSVQEFRTQTSLYDAASGFNSGGNINLITRSGTNRYHGGLYEYFRNRDMNANDFFFNRAGKPRPVLIQNQFGGSLGGPLPKISKTFWFFNYEGARQRNGITGAISTGPIVPVLPATRDAATLASLYQLPVGAIDPVAINILNARGQYGGFLFPSGTNAPTGQLGEFVFSAPVHLTSNQYNGRVDHDFKTGSVANSLAIVYFSNPDTFFNPGGANSGILGQPYQYNLRNDTTSIHDTQTIRPNLLNEITFGVTYNLRDIRNVNPVTVQDIKMQRFNSGLVTGTPDLSFAEGLNCCGASASVGENQHNESQNFRDLVSYIKGRHSLRMGFEVRTQQFNFSVPLDRGSLSFLSLNADHFYGAPTDPNLDISFCDFLIGAPVSTFISSGLSEFGYRAHDFALFTQDDFRVTSRLTLNLGLRWDYLGNITEDHDFISNFDPSRLDANTRMFGGPGLQKAFIMPSGLKGFGTPRISKSTLNSQDLKNFAPRIGFAYDAFGNGKMAVRGGFGMYYVRVGSFGVLQTLSNPPFSLGTSSIDIFTGQQLLSNPFPTLPLPNQFPVPFSQFPFPTLTSIDPVTGAPNFDQSQIAATQISPNLHTPYTEQYNLAIQYEFLHRWTVEVGYLGTHGLKIEIAQSLNNALLRNANNPGPFGLATNAVDNTETRVPYVGLCSGCLFAITNGGKSHYNALLLTITHQFSKGLYFKAAYTFSKSLDNNPTLIGFEPGIGATGNQFIPDLNYGLSSFDVRHRLVATYVYDLPGPKEGWASKVIAHWSVSGITTYQSGFANEIDQFNPVGTFSGSSGYGVILPNCALMSGGSVSDHIRTYLNKACVQVQPILPPGATFGPMSPFEGPGNQTFTVTPGSAFGGGALLGSSTRGAFRNPFQTRWDMALTKTFPWGKLGESGNIQFIAQAFKLFNTPIFNAPGNIVGFGSFGRISRTIDNTGRQLQLALRLNF